jgi:fructokinase
MEDEEIYTKIEKLKGEFDILCIGELLTDYISKEDKPLNDIKVFDKFFGGSPANIVFHMRNLGKRPLLITKIGDDDDGKFLLKTLEKHDILKDHVVIDTEKDTTKAFIKRHVDTPDFEILRGADTQLRPDDVDMDMLKKAKVVHTNAFTLAEQPTRDTVIATIKKAHELGKLISFDPNYRQKVWPDRKEALKVFKQMYSLADLTKPSMDDAKEIFGDLKPKEFIKRFHDLGAKIVVLTMGRKGSLISTGNHTIKILPEQCDGKDATGAGDVYWAVLLISLLEGNRLELAGRKASYAAAKTVKKSGAILEKTDYEEIIAFMRML